METSAKLIALLSTETPCDTGDRVRVRFNPSKPVSPQVYSLRAGPQGGRGE